MNSAPAELLHPLTYAALQPNSRHVFRSICCDRPLKSRQSQNRRRKSVSERTNLFPKKKPPYPIESDKAVWSEENLSVVYCSLIWIVAFRFFCMPGRHFLFPTAKCSCLIFQQYCTSKLYSQLSAPPVWYSMTRVSKKLRSFFRSIISLIQGKGFSSCSNIGSKPICCARRFAMNRR